MKLTIKNIGKIKDAVIEFNGISVIAGENNTGKSTVGKVLFAVCNSFYDLDRTIEANRRKSVENLVSRLYLISGKRFITRNNEGVIADQIIKRTGKYVNKRTELDLQEEIIDIIEEYDENGGQNIDKKILADVSSNILASLQVTDYEILTSIIEKRLEAEFSGQISNIFNEDHGDIRLEFKGRIFQAWVKGRGISKICNQVVLPVNADIIYIDDPFILDDYQMYLPPFFYGFFDHQSYLRSKINKLNKKANVVDEIVVNEKLKSIFDKISFACRGDIVFDKNHFVFREINTVKSLNLHNLSTGLKTFAMLKMLLLNNTISQGSVLILDEPEIHLHPEWQVLFAEIIILLQKEFDLHILINTHSPYFLRAIEVFAAKHGMHGNCKYYLSENKGKGAIISDVTNNVEKIYEKLARPLQTLENERWSDASAE